MFIFYFATVNFKSNYRSLFFKKLRNCYVLLSFFNHCALGLKLKVLAWCRGIQDQQTACKSHRNIDYYYLSENVHYRLIFDDLLFCCVFQVRRLRNEMIRIVLNFYF